MEKTVLANTKFPKIMTSLAEQNHYLKILTYSLLGLTTLILLLLVYSFKRGPEVIALEYSGQVAKIETEMTEPQVQSAAKEYLKYRYSWNSQTISSQLKKAEAFILPQLLSSYQKSMVEVQKFLRDKKVVQRVYPQSVDVDFKNKTISITADRITEFESLKAATILRLKLSFDTEDRTPLNPWGIYVTKEVEGVDQ